jgi:hypothetical protein
MTTEQPPRTGDAHAEEAVPRTPAPAPADAVGEDGRGSGWVRFGGVVMAVIGAFAIIEGLIALFSPLYLVAVGGTVLALSVGGWGWLHLILGILVLVTGLGLLRDDAPAWTRGTAVVLVALNMIVQLAWLPAYPIWSIVLLVLDVLVLRALIVTWPGRPASAHRA